MEMMVLALLAIIVVGPKDLPRVMPTVRCAS
jgi:Sec-independent protein translocase protein TatA